MKEDLLKIIEHYGVKHQCKKLNEECYELIEAIGEYEEDYIKVDCNEEWVLPFMKEHLTEEIADVMVLIEQIRHYYNISSEEVTKIFWSKVDRQLDRMSKE